MTKTGKTKQAKRLFAADIKQIRFPMLAGLEP